MAKTTRSKLKKIISIIGPGFITGASDDDPSGIGTYAQTGAQFGYSQLWTALFTLPFMAVVQEMSGRIGLVTGQGLAKTMKQHYAKPLVYGAVILLLLANTVNIGADLGAMAASGQLVFGIPFAFWLIGLTVLTVLLEIFVSYKTYARFLKYLAMFLLVYVIAAFVVKQDWGKIALSTFIPQVSLTKEYWLNIVALLGTTISPYLFFWQAGEEVEEEVEHHKFVLHKYTQPEVDRTDMKRLRADTVLGMIFSNLITFFIIITAAATLHTGGGTSIETASQAAEALRPLAGDFAFVLFALGVIGTGLLAIPVLAGSASYALSETFGWKEGLSLKFKQARGFYGIIAVATVLGLLINLTPIKPFQLLYYTAVLNGMIAPPLLLLILHIANNKQVMGEHTNSSFSNVMGWIIALLMFIASGALILSYFV